jgi:hypothetical protein
MRAERFETVCSFDPGIDTRLLTALTMGQFTEDRDITKIRHAFRSDEPPTIYGIREIPQPLWKSYVMGVSSDELRFERAFQVGVYEVKNLYQKDGVRLEHWKGGATKDVLGQQLEVISDAELQSFSPADVQEIGAVAYFHSFLHRRIKSCFQQPRTCRQILAGLEFLIAESTPT